MYIRVNAYYLNKCRNIKTLFALNEFSNVIIVYVTKRVSSDSVIM